MFFNIYSDTKKNYLLDFASYSLLIIMVLVAGLLSNSLTVSQKNYADRTFGMYDAYLTSVSSEECNALLATQPLQMSNCYTIGALSGESEKTFVLGHYDGTIMVPLRLVEGRMPTSEDEIAIEEWVLYNLSSYKDEKGNLEIDYIGFDGEQYHKTFKIVGILDNYTHRTNYEKASHRERDPEQMLPGIITNPNLSNKNLQHAFLIFENPEEEVNALQNVYGQRLICNEDRQNHNVDLIASKFYSIFILLSAMGVVCLVGGVIVQKKFQTNLTIQMKCAGATNAFCLAFRIWVTLWILIPALITGFLLGTAISKLYIDFVFSKIIDYTFFAFSPNISLMACAIAFFTVLLSTFLIQLLICKERPFSKRSKKEAAPIKPLKISRSTFEKHPFAVWGIKSVHYNSAKYTAVILSLVAILVVIVNTRVAFDDIKAMYKKSILADYNLTSFRGGFFTPLDISTDQFMGFEDSDIQNILKTGDVNKCYAFSRYHFHVLANPSKSNYSPLKNIKENEFFDLSSLPLVFEKYGYNQSDELYCTTIYGLSDTFLNDILSEYGLLNTFDSSTHVILFTNQDNAGFKVGDRIHFSQPFMQKSGNINRIDMDLTIAAILPSQEIGQKYFSRTGTFFSIANNCLIHHNINKGYETLLVYLSNKNDYENADKILQQISTLHDNDPAFTYLSERENNSERERELGIAAATEGILVFIILIYCLTTLYSLFFSKMNLQKKTWGYLRSSGIDFKNAILYHFSEVFVINFFAWFAAVGISIILIFLLRPEFGVFKIFSPKVILMTPLVSTLLCGVVSMIPVCIFWKKRFIQLIHGL